MTKRHSKEYPPTKIQPPKLAPYTHMRKHNVNQTIEKANQIIMVLFKQKMKPDEQTMINLLKYFGIQIPKGNGMILDVAELKKPDFLYTVNLKIM